MSTIIRPIVLCMSLILAAVAQADSPAAPAAKAAPPANRPAASEQVKDRDEMQQLQLQSQQDQRTRAQQTTSSLLKKKSDSEKAAQSNLK